MRWSSPPRKAFKWGAGGSKAHSWDGRRTSAKAIEHADASVLMEPAYPWNARFMPFHFVIRDGTRSDPLT